MQTSVGGFVNINDIGWPLSVLTDLTTSHLKTSQGRNAAES